LGRWCDPGQVEDQGIFEAAQFAFIDAFVDGLDLAAESSSRVRAVETDLGVSWIGFGYEPAASVR
jgi:hypothetical protein